MIMAKTKPSKPDIAKSKTCFNETFHLTTLLSFTDNDLSNGIDNANDKPKG